MTEHVVDTGSGRITASTSALADATAELIHGLRRLSKPDDLRAVVDWDMDSDWEIRRPE